VEKTITLATNANQGKLVNIAEWILWIRKPDLRTKLGELILLICIFTKQEKSSKIIQKIRY